MAIITGTNAADLLIGTAGDDTMSGVGGDDLIAGGAGNDVLNGGAGADILIGGTLSVTGGVGTVVLHPGNRDTVSYADTGDQITVHLSITETMDITRMGISMHLTGMVFSRDDFLIGIENVVGGSAPDDLFGDDKDNIFVGNNGYDHMFSYGGNDILVSGIETTSDGASGFLCGGSGSDVLIDGGISISNGIGTVLEGRSDQYAEISYEGSAKGVSIDLSVTQTVDVTRAGVSLHLQNAVAGHGGDAEGDLLLGIDGVTGSPADDRLVGNGSTRLLDGGLGDDVVENAAALRGWDGTDTLIGDADGSEMYGGLGADVLDGRAGSNDSASYRYAAVTIDLTQGTGRGGDAEGDVLIGIENVDVTRFSDRVIGAGSAGIMVLGLGDDVAYGLGGADNLQGEDGNDRLVGGAGADVLSGGNGLDWAYYHTGAAGVAVNLATGLGTGGEAQGDVLSGIEAIYGSARSDTLTGDALANVLLGNTGADRLTGGGQADTFMYLAVSDSTVAAAGRDTILDFTRAQGDRINLWAIDAAAAGGDQAFSFIGTGAYTGVAGQLHYAVSGSTTIVAGDVDGDRASDFYIVLNGVIAMTAGDFVL